MRKNTWNLQLCKIQDKGFEAFQQGIPLDQCPYQEGYHNQNGPGGSLQRQRRQAWYAGWQEAKKKSKEQ